MVDDDGGGASAVAMWVSMPVPMSAWWRCEVAMVNDGRISWAMTRRE